MDLRESLPGSFQFLTPDEVRQQYMHHLKTLEAQILALHVTTLRGTTPELMGQNLDLRRQLLAVEADFQAWQLHQAERECVPAVAEPPNDAEWRVSAETSSPEE